MYTMLTLYVNNLLIIGPSNASVADVRNTLMARFVMTDVGDVTQLVGTEVKRNKEAYNIELLIEYTLGNRAFQHERFSSAYARDWKGTQTATRRKCVSRRTSYKVLSGKSRQPHVPRSVHGI